jgi:hypothetical protein
MLTKVIPVTTRITEENLPFDKVSYIRYGRIGFKEHSDSQQSVTNSQLIRASQSVTRSHLITVSRSAASRPRHDIRRSGLIVKERL